MARAAGPREDVTARFLVTAIGLLSHRDLPDFPGLGSFAGESHHTGAWPEGVDLAGKRVGVIGTGSTGIQVITEVTPIVDHLTAFQRSPQYSAPSDNGPVTLEEAARIERDCDKIWAGVRDSIVFRCRGEYDSGDERVRRGASSDVPGSLGQGLGPAGPPWHRTTAAAARSGRSRSAPGSARWWRSSSRGRAH